MRKIVRVPGTNVLRRLRSFDAITSWSIEVPDYLLEQSGTSIDHEVLMQSLHGQ